MSALLKLPFDTEEDAAGARDFEALTHALNEITARCAAGAVALDRANARRAELMSEVSNARDAYLPPITFYGIEEGERTAGELSAFEDESAATNAEIRRLQKLTGRTDALINGWVREVWKISTPWQQLSFRYRRLLLGMLREKAKHVTSLKGA